MRSRQLVRHDGRRLSTRTSRPTAPKSRRCCRTSPTTAASPSSCSWVRCHPRRKQRSAPPLPAFRSSLENALRRGALSTPPTSAQTPNHSPTCTARRPGTRCRRASVAPPAPAFTSSRPWTAWSPRHESCNVTTRIASGRASRPWDRCRLSSRGTTAAVPSGCSSPSRPTRTTPTRPPPGPRRSTKYELTRSSSRGGSWNHSTPSLPGTRSTPRGCGTRAP